MTASPSASTGEPNGPAPVDVVLGAGIGGLPLHGGAKGPTCGTCSRRLA